jgi:hypothetical protein
MAAFIEEELPAHKNAKRPFRGHIAMQIDFFEII